MKKLIVILFMLFSVYAFAAEMGTQVYYGAWSDKAFPAYDKTESINVYCGWWSAISIVSVSEEPQEVSVTVYAGGEKYELEITLGKYGVYAKHVYDMVEEAGYDPMICKRAFTVKVENTPFTYSMFLIHNGSHSYDQ